MRKSFAIAALCVLATVFAGCVTQPSRPKPAADRVAAPSIPQADKDAVIGGEDDFLKMVAGSRFDLVKSIVLPSQATGFDGKSFVEDRFRMKTGDFTMVGWDMNSIGVTSAKRGEVLTSCAVTVKLAGSDQAKAVIVNLYWQKQAGRWYLVPYPQAE